MILPSALVVALSLLPAKGAAKAPSAAPKDDPALLRRACPDFTTYAEIPQ